MFPQPESALLAKFYVHFGLSQIVRIQIPLLEIIPIITVVFKASDLILKYILYRKSYTKITNIYLESLSKFFKKSEE